MTLRAVRAGKILALTATRDVDSHAIAALRGCHSLLDFAGLRDACGIITEFVRRRRCTSQHG
jgi:hypothetical protein